MRQVSSSSRQHEIGSFSIAVVLLCVVALAHVGATAQTKKRGTAAELKKTQTSSQSLKVQYFSNTAVPTISFRAQDVPLVELVAEISRQINLPITLSPVVQKSRSRVTLEIDKAPLELAVRTLTPQVFADYVVSSEAAQPKLLGFHLSGMNEPEPPPPSSPGLQAQVVEIELDAVPIIDDPDAESERRRAAAAKRKAENQEEPLQVTYKDGRISIKARQQPLSVVLHEISQKVNIPYEVTTYNISSKESLELVDVEFRDYTLEDAVRSLASPAVRLYMRTELHGSQKWPLRIVQADTEAARN